jgi:hypothetical protein
MSGLALLILAGREGTETLLSVTNIPVL